MALGDNRDWVRASLTEAGSRVRVRSALNPALWLCALVTVAYVVTATLNKEAPLLLSWALGVVLAATILGFLWLLFFDRDRLQSEEYLIRMRTLELMREKGSRKAVDTATVRAVSGADFLNLSGPPKEGDP